MTKEHKIVEFKTLIYTILFIIVFGYVVGKKRLSINADMSSTMSGCSPIKQINHEPQNDKKNTLVIP